jgi:hypothetical protein
LRSFPATDRLAVAARSRRTDQVALCREFAAQQGWEVVNGYADRAVSGTSTHGRNEYALMCADGEAGRFDIILAEDLDRLSRKQADTSSLPECEGGVTIHVEDNMATIQGGCLCGAVRYGADAEPAIVAVCHCRDCQKFTGGAFAFLIAVPKTAIEFKGVLKTFSSPADSCKPVSRHFCPECGSSIAEESSSLPGHVIISGGTLDDSSSIRPSMEIYCDRALSWVHLGGMQRFAKMPPIPQGSEAEGAR